MSTAQARYGTRWRRAAYVAVPAMVTLGFMAGSVHQEVLAESVVFQSGEATLAAGGIEGDRTAIGVVSAVQSNGGSDRRKNVIRVGMAGLKVDGLCLSRKQSIAGLDYTVKIRTGDGKADTFETVGSNGTIDLQSIKGGESGLNLDGLVQLGVTSESVTTTEVGGGLTPNPLDAPAGEGWFAIDADVGQFRNVRGTVYGLTLDELSRLDGFKLIVEPGNKSCADEDVPH